MRNLIEIHGYLGRDPELKEYKNNRGETGELVNFSVGVSRDYGDETDWFDVTMFGKRAKVIEKFFGRGSQIVVWGRMQSSTKDGQDGKKHKYWTLVAEGFDFCDSKDSPRGSAIVETDSFKAAEDDIPF